MLNETRINVQDYMAEVIWSNRNEMSEDSNLRVPDLEKTDTNLLFRIRTTNGHYVIDLREFESKIGLPNIQDAVKTSIVEQLNFHIANDIELPSDLKLWFEKNKSKSVNQERLIFTISDDGGTQRIYFVDSKDMKFVVPIIYADINDPDRLWERLCDEDNESIPNILKGITAKYNIELNNVDISYIWENLHDFIQGYFEDLISDNSITLAEFSQQLTELIVTDRYSGCACKWINV